MGAGTYGAGIGLAGLDPVSRSNAVVAIDQAAKYDPQQRILPFNLDGTIVDVNATDEFVAFALTVKKKTFRSAPDVGIDADRFKQLTVANADELIGDVVRDALKTPLANGDITIEKILIDYASIPLGKTRFQTVYKNLRTTNGAATPVSSIF